MLKRLLVAGALSVLPFIAAASGEPAAAASAPVESAWKEQAKGWLQNEAVIAGLSGLVSADPEDWGRAMAIMSPIVLMGYDDPRSAGSNGPIVMSALTLAWGLYNAQELGDEKRYGYNEAFKRNMVALNGVLLGTWAFTALEPHRSFSRGRVAALILDDGAMLRLSRSF